MFSLKKKHFYGVLFFVVFARKFKLKQDFSLTMFVVLSMLCQNNLIINLKI